MTARQSSVIDEAIRLVRGGWTISGAAKASGAHISSVRRAM